MRLLLLSFSLSLSCFGQGFDYANLPFLGSGNNGSPLDGAFLYLDIYASLITNTNNVSPSSKIGIKFWQDISGNANNVQNLSVSSSTPTYSLTGGPVTNGPCMIFTHSNFTFFTNSTLVSQQSNMFYFVFNDRQDSGTQSGFFDPTTADRIGEFEFRDPGHTPGVAYGIYDGNANVYIGGYNDIPNGLWSILTLTMVGTNSQIRTNGIFSNRAGISDPGTNAIHGLTLGNYFNFTQGADMDLVAFVWYTGVQHTTNQMKLIEEALGGRFNISVP